MDEQLLKDVRHMLTHGYSTEQVIAKVEAKTIDTLLAGLQGLSEYNYDCEVMVIRGDVEALVKGVRL